MSSNDTTALQPSGSAWSAIRARLFHTVFLLRRPMTLGVRALIHDEKSASVFLIRHTYVPGWQLPGGGVERGETANMAMEREIQEECAIELTAPAELRSVHFNRQASRRDHVLFYIVRGFRIVAPKQPDREIAATGLFPIDRLPSGTTQGTRRRIAEVFEGASASPYW